MFKISALPGMLFVLLAWLSIAMAMPFADSSAFAVNNLGHFPNGTRVQSEAAHLASRSPSCSTNAECLLRGLPLLPLRATRPRSALKPRASGDLGYRTGYLQLFDSAGTSLGFLSSNLNNFYGQLVDSTTAGALLISFNAASSGFTDQINIAIATQTAPYTTLALGKSTYFVRAHRLSRNSHDSVLGYASPDSDMRTGSSDNAFIAGAQESRPAGTRPGKVNDSFSHGQKDSETAVFNFNADTSEFGSSWVDTNGNLITTFFLYSLKNAAINTSADVNAFISQVDSTYSPVTIEFVPQ